MNRHLKLGVLGVVAALLAAAVGYGAGYRSGWRSGIMADAAVRGSLALSHLKLLNSGRTDDARLLLESDVDSGLLWWSQLEQSPTYPLLNLLSGEDVVPDHERYVRRLATYRSANPSPLLDPVAQSRMRSNVADPAIAAEMGAGFNEARANMDRMVAKYGR